jgi:putative membrane protein
VANASDTAIRDRLALERTHMANERTLLAYVRTTLGFVIVGVPAVWWLDHPHAQVLGVVSLTAGLLCLAIGIRRFITINRMIARSPGTASSLHGGEESGVL